MASTRRRRLRRVDCSGPGYTRVVRGKTVTYLNPDGSELTDPEVLERVTSLVLPPAWTDVWVCPWDHGHIQATGLDAAGRRQYVYHPVWREQQDRIKFDRVLDAAEALPAARQEMAGALAGRGLTRPRVMACAVRLLDLGFFRVGGEQYAESNGSFGLATMRRDHVSVSRSGLITFDYVAKSGKHRVQQVADPAVTKVVRSLLRRDDAGEELLAWRRADGTWADVSSSDINAHVAQLLGQGFSAKDFRTWSATVLASVGLAVAAGTAESPTARKRAVAHVVKEVSHYLGNTPAVCRASYIDPRVIDLYQGGVTIADSLDSLGAGWTEGGLATQGQVEAAVVALLRNPPAVRRKAG